MFSKHFDRMRPAATPERVLAVCRAVGRDTVPKDEIIHRLYLDETAPAPAEEFAESLKVADQELGIISLKDGMYRLAVNETIIASTTAFRRWISRKVFQDPSTTFFMITKWYIAKNNEVTLMGNWEDKAVLANREGIDLVDNNSFLGWRFWAAFLGIGYISDTTLIPNLYTRVKDVLTEEIPSSFSNNSLIPAGDFLNWLFTKIPEANTANSGAEPLCLALSNALRTLRDNDEVELLSERDSLKRRLFMIEEDRNNDFSHIIIKEAAIK